MTTTLDMLSHGTPSVRWVVLVLLLVLVALWGFDRIPKIWLAIVALVLIAVVTLDAL